MASTGRNQPLHGPRHLVAVPDLEPREGRKNRSIRNLYMGSRVTTWAGGIILAGSLAFLSGETLGIHPFPGQTGDPVPTAMSPAQVRAAQARADAAANALGVTDTNSPASLRRGAQVSLRVDPGQGATQFIDKYIGGVANSTSKLRHNLIVDFQEDDPNPHAGDWVAMPQRLVRAEYLPPAPPAPQK